jgi:CelD/BcsL family acetyltransferase involved in cellulose biosynthesis
MKWQLHDRSRFLELYDNWAIHIDEAPLGNPFLHPDFMHTAIEHFGKDRVRILQGTEDGQARFLLPITRRMHGCWRTFSPSQLPVAPIYDNGEHGQPFDLEGIFAALSPGTVMFEILNYDPDYAPAIHCGARPSERIRYGDTICIDGHARFSEYWDSRAKKLRDNIRRYSRRVANAGMEISLAIAESPAEAQRALAMYGEIESAGWKGNAGTAISSENAQGRFYSEVLERFSARRRAKIFELKFNETTVASRIAITHNETVFFLKTTYLQDYAKYSPGRLLLHATIRHCFDTGDYLRMEFCTNANRDMLQWGSVSREIAHLNIFRNDSVRRSKRFLDSVRGLFVK